MTKRGTEPPLKVRMSTTAEESDLRAAVQYAVIQCCSEEDATGSTKMTSRALTALAELTYMYATTCLSADLQAFSDHAGRRTITEADVQLTARKNPDGLLDKLRIYCQDNLNDDEKVGKRKRRKTNRPLDLQSGPAATGPKEAVYEASSEDSSTDDEAVAFAKPRATTTKTGSKNAFSRMDDDDDTSDSDIMEMRRPAAAAATKRKPPPKTGLSLDSSTDEENLLAPVPRRPPLKTTHRSAAATVPAVATTAGVTKNRSSALGDDSSEEENLEPAAPAVPRPPIERGLPTVSSTSAHHNVNRAPREPFDDSSEEENQKPVGAASHKAPTDKRFRLSLKSGGENDDADDNNSHGSEGSDLLRSPDINQSSVAKSSTLQILANLSDDSVVSEQEHEIDDL